MTATQYRENQLIAAAVVFVSYFLFFIYRNTSLRSSLGLHVCAMCVPCIDTYMYVTGLVPFLLSPLILLNIFLQGERECLSVLTSEVLFCRLEQKP